MKRNILNPMIYLTAYFLAATQILSAQNLSDEMVRKATTPLIKHKVVDGISVGYIQGDRHGTVHLGHTARGKGTANNNTLYEIASISKVFTSLLLSDAVVRGEIDLNAAANVDNSADLKLPTYNDRSIKWIDLSTHRSGLPRLPENMDATSLINPYESYDSKKAAAALANLELPRSPGESQEYSNFAVSVLGYLIVENAGKSYQQLLQERIAKPLGMSDCTVSPSADQKKRHSTPHKSVGVPTPIWTCADLPGAGGVHASMKDMMRFAGAQLNPPESKLGEAIELAWKQHSKADNSSGAMGLGWQIHHDGEARWHNGQTGGSHSMLLIDRKNDFAIIVLSNTAALELDVLAFELWNQATVEEAAAKADLNIDAEHRARLVGKYQLAPNFILDVKDRDGRLMVGVTNQPTMEVFPDSKTHWSYKSVKATLEFKLPNKGPSKSLVIHQNGIKQTAKRMEENPAADKKKAVAVPTIDSEHRARLVGKYKLAPNFIFDVQDQDGHLMVGITNQPTQEVFPDSKTRWSYKGVKATLEFKLRNKGPAKSLVLHQNGNKQTAKRMKN